jgi:hypothetical protein
MFLVMPVSYRVSMKYILIINKTGQSFCNKLNMWCILCLPTGSRNGDIQPSFPS